MNKSPWERGPEADLVCPLPQAEPTLAKRKDDDGRLPIHWAASANQLDITQLLAEQKGFDVDIQVWQQKWEGPWPVGAHMLKRTTSHNRMRSAGRRS